MFIVATPPKPCPSSAGAARAGSLSRALDFKLLANALNRSFLDFAVARHAGDLPVGRIEPDRVRAALAKEAASLPAQVALQVAELHASTNSSGSRRALGDRSFSARSRWHSSTSLSASSRFALASPRVSPCEIAAGTSSTKQVYPPSLAGSKTAVSFMPRGCHTAPPLASRREDRLAHAEPEFLITRFLTTDCRLLITGYRSLLQTSVASICSCSNEAAQ